MEHSNCSSEAVELANGGIAMCCNRLLSRSSRGARPLLKVVEIGGDHVGTLTKDCVGDVRFFSQTAPYDLLDGTRYVGVMEADEAIGRMRRLARPVKLQPRTTGGKP